MAIIAQLVRVPDCGSEGRGFESHLPPDIKKSSSMAAFLIKNQRYECRKIENRACFFAYSFPVYEWMSEKESRASSPGFDSL